MPSNVHVFDCLPLKSLNSCECSSSKICLKIISKAMLKHLHLNCVTYFAVCMKTRLSKPQPNWKTFVQGQLTQHYNFLGPRPMPKMPLQIITLFFYQIPCWINILKCLKFLKDNFNSNNNPSLKNNQKRRLRPNCDPRKCFDEVNLK